MEFTSYLIDHKIMGVNVGAELAIGEYLAFASAIVQQNEYQRRRVRSSGKTYDLLAKDLIDGCIMPPIILAVSGAYAHEVDGLLREIFDRGVGDDARERLQEIVRRAANDRQLLILDGLQRTLTMLSMVEPRDLFEDEGARHRYLQHRIRIEVYVGLSKMGILYRMLTLNTGQTPMSFRHQLEILYHDYIDNGELPDGIEVVREADERRARGGNRYKYQDVVDMFYAYSTGSPMPYDRHALVGELREMKFLESYTYRANVDEMKSILVAYNRFLTKVSELAPGWHLELEDGPAAEVARPFGSTVSSIFGRPQPMAGFGAECKRLVELGRIQNFDELAALIDTLEFRTAEAPEALARLVKVLDEIAAKAKKIGDAQRSYFQLAFRALFLRESEAFGDLAGCWLSGQETYEVMH